MAWWEILVGIILFIVALGVLIGIHELGHLSAAKMFHVYCFNYSIGFGPKLISSKRTKKHETIWTLRAIPLGGFVSMYGEGAELDTDEYIPPNRSLEGVARYKRAIIISAGVILNFVLGFVLILLHNGCFDQVRFNFAYPNATRHISAVTVNINDELKLKGINDGDSLKLVMDPFTGVFMIQEDAKIEGIEDTKYFVCMSNTVTTTKIDPLISDSLVIVGQKDVSTFITDKITSGYNNNELATILITNWGGNPYNNETFNETIKKIEKTYPLPINDQDPLKEEKIRVRNELFTQACTEYYDLAGYTHVPDLSLQYKIDKNFPGIKNVNLSFYDQNHEIKNVAIDLSVAESNDKIKDIGVYMKREFYHYNFSQCFQATWSEWCNSNTAVFRGLGMLFTGQGDVSGPIGIAQMSTNILANFGFERYLYLWGMISCNLAILNLLPFPGLDGWQLLVIGYEAITKKQIPTKVKGIISVIGLGLLFLLMIFIIIKDIMRLII